MVDPRWPWSCRRRIIRPVLSMSRVTEMDWHAWHDGYDEPGTRLARRLAAVQEQIRVALDAAPPGPLHAVSLCAGQGRDLIASGYRQKVLT